MAVCSGKTDAGLHEKNVFPNQTENLRAERKFDLSGMLIRA